MVPAESLHFLSAKKNGWKESQVSSHPLAVLTGVGTVGRTNPSLIDEVAPDESDGCPSWIGDDEVPIPLRGRRGRSDLKVDPILIEQVLLNLMKNAAEAIDLANLPPPRRHLELRVVPRYTPEDGGGIEFSVTDAGPGLPEEVINRLYEAFFSTKSDGMGIGLSLCRSIVESHHGRMRAQNLYNGNQVVGCRFSFTLPVELPAPAEAPGAPTTVETPSTPRATAPEPATPP